jgi:phosphoenolpyruvate carboxylase
MMLSRCRALTSSSSAVHRVLGTATVNSFLPTLVNHHRPLGRSSHITVPLTAAFSTSLSSFTEPNPTLFRNRDDDGSLHSAAIPTAIKDDVDAQLRHDIRVLGSLLGQIIQEHDDDPNDNEANGIFAKVEFLRHHAKRWRASGKQTLHELADYCSTFTDRELFLVARAFTHFLALANAAETHHRARRLQAADASGALHAKPDSCGGVLPALIARGVDPDVIYQALTTQTTELVLTAHPTEVNRRTILEKKRRIQELLKQADLFRATGASSFAANELNKAMRAEIASIWQSDEVARTKPSPETEAEKGTLVVETVLWKTLPLFLRKLDATCQEFLNKSLPLDAAPIRFASWMGGDRDGNPNVKPTTTRKVCMKNRAKAAKLFAQDLVVLRNKLSITTCSSEIRAIVGDDVREPYRAFLKPMIEKMERTVEWAEHELANLEHNRTGSSGDAIPANEIYLNKEEFKEKLMMIRQSLYDSGNEAAADGLLTDVLRNLSSFGLTLIPLDVRQESERHEEAVDAITRFLGLGSYSQWDESSKINWLTTQISSKRPLIRPGVWREHPDIFSETAVDTLEIFEMIKDQHEDSLGAYVISQATTASDVLAVLLLQLDAGVKKPLRIAPLFETLADLQGAADTMKSLFSLPVYMGIINGKQEVMIGYSDSAKDAVRIETVLLAVFVCMCVVVCLLGICFATFSGSTCRQLGSI